MTTQNDARKAVYDRFIAQWPAASTNVAFTLDNEKFTPPAGLPWARLSVRTVVGKQNTLGPELHRRFGTDALVFIQVFTPVDTGTKESDRLMRAAKGIFEGVSFGGLRMKAATPKEIGVEGGWFQALVEVPFDYEETK